MGACAAGTADQIADTHEERGQPGQAEEEQHAAYQPAQSGAGADSRARDPRDQHAAGDRHDHAQRVHGHPAAEQERLQDVALDLLDHDDPGEHQQGR